MFGIINKINTIKEQRLEKLKTNNVKSAISSRKTVAIKYSIQNSSQKSMDESKEDSDTLNHFY